MTGGMGRGSRGDSSSNSIIYGIKTRAAKASRVGAVSGVKCGMCMGSLGDIFIDCDGCNYMYHPSHVCLGLHDSIINTIKENGGRSIKICCTSCRLDKT